MGDNAVDFFLETLKQLITSCNLDLIIKEKHQLQYLQEKIEYLRGFLKVTEKKRNERRELLKLAMQIRDVVSETGNIVLRFVVDLVKADASCSLGEHQDHLSLDLESVKKEIKTLTDEVMQIYDENMYDSNGGGMKKLVYSSTAIGGGSSSSRGRHTSKFGGEKVVVGFEKEVEKLIQRLDNKGVGLEIISIIGAAGGGKTTLAREVYQHPFTSYIFEIRAWVNVSGDYDKTMKRNLLICILKSASPENLENYEKSSEDLLGEKVHKCLKGRKYLIVMDDIWGIEAWNDIQRSFPKECKGSKVLFTSRLVVQPDDISYIPHDLAPLSIHWSWKLLEKKVFGMKGCPQELVGIGEEIARRCDGLPLAIVAISGILTTENMTLNVWKEVAKNISTIIANKNQEGCMDILELSYRHLPSHLKRCFVYIGGFPEDYEIPVRTLLWLWVAKGFIQPNERGKSLEATAKDYLINLIDRNLVVLARKSSLDGIKACRIHDLWRIFCLEKAEVDNFQLAQINKKGDSFSPFRISHKHRRLFVHPIIKLPQDICKIVELRHLHHKEGIFEYHFSHLCSEKAMRNFFKLDSLQTLHRICSCKDCQSFLVTTPNLRKLGFFGALISKDRVLMLPDLEFLKCLEKLSFTNMRFFGMSEKGNTLPAGLKLPLTITQLTLKNTLLKWEELSIFQTLPILEVLKLLDDACTGRVWNANELEGFFQLKYLRFEYLNLVTWNASADQFPRLEVLVIDACLKLERIPIDFGNLNELREIKLVWCTQSAEDSTREIQEEQRYKNGDDDCLHLVSTRWSTTEDGKWITRRVEYPPF